MVTSDKATGWPVPKSILVFCLKWYRHLSSEDLRRESEMSERESWPQRVCSGQREDSQAGELEHQKAPCKFLSLFLHRPGGGTQGLVRARQIPTTELTRPSHGGSKVDGAFSWGQETRKLTQTRWQSAASQRGHC